MKSPIARSTALRALARDTPLEDLGPLEVKIGQMLALRPDLVEDSRMSRLMLLFDRVPPFGWSEARAIVEADLGMDVYEAFADIDPQPRAAGSLAQTHLATLLDGELVAVKVQRPDVREVVERELENPKRLARIIGRSGLTGPVDPLEVVSELSDWIRSELDFERELANLTRLEKFARDSSVETIPHPVPELCGPHVVTAEYLYGLPFASLLREPGLLSEVERDDLAEDLVHACLTQVFRYRFFHADLHPGNLIALDDGTIGFVDFGLCDNLDERVARRHHRYLSAVYTGDVDLMFDALVEILESDERSDMGAFRRDFSAETRTLLSSLDGVVTSAARRSPAMRRSPIGSYMVEVMRLAHRHGMRVPPRVLSMWRALLTAETVATQLSDHADLRSVGRRFFARLQMEEDLSIFTPKGLQPLLHDKLTLMREGPGNVQSVLADLAEGRFLLNVLSEEGPNQARAARARVSVLTIAILTVGLSVVVASTTLAEPLRVPLAAVLIGMYGAVLWLIRRLR